MKKISTWLRVGLFLVVVVAAVVIYVIPALSDTAPGGPKLSFGGGETCQLGGSLEEFNAAGFYMSDEIQNYTYTGRKSQDKIKVYLGSEREQSCGNGHLINKSDGRKRGIECMVYAFELRYEDGGHMTCDGTEILGNTQEAIRVAFGTPAERYSDSDLYRYSKSGRTYSFRFYFDDDGMCTKVLAAQIDPKLSFY